MYELTTRVYTIVAMVSLWNQWQTSGRQMATIDDHDGDHGCQNDFTLESLATMMVAMVFQECTPLETSCIHWLP